ncbi:hypothetical protein DFJ74DRAFT_720433 [Hyaloraphidium curvatum]|nr:hypothetical protein DFJ74DRAFT_720433 [Hyaloraphidium curvatum]
MPPASDVENVPPARSAAPSASKASGGASAAPPNARPSPAELAKFKLPALKELCASLGVNKTGSKKELFARAAAELHRCGAWAADEERAKTAEDKRRSDYAKKAVAPVAAKYREKFGPLFAAGWTSAADAAMDRANGAKFDLHDAPHLALLATDPAIPALDPDATDAYAAGMHAAVQLVKLGCGRFHAEAAARFAARMSRFEAKKLFDDALAGVYRGFLVWCGPEAVPGIINLLDQAAEAPGAVLGACDCAGLEILVSALLEIVVRACDADMTEEAGHAMLRLLRSMLEIAGVQGQDHAPHGSTHLRYAPAKEACSLLALALLDLAPHPSLRTPANLALVRRAAVLDAGMPNGALHRADAGFLDACAAFGTDPHPSDPLARHPYRDVASMWRARHGSQAPPATVAYSVPSEFHPLLSCAQSGCYYDPGWAPLFMCPGGCGTAAFCELHAGRFALPKDGGKGTAEGMDGKGILEDRDHSRRCAFRRTVMGGTEVDERGIGVCLFGME